MDTAPVGHNPNSSVFQGGDSVQITPMAGGGPPSVVAGLSLPNQNVLNNLPPPSRQTVVNAAVQAGFIAAVTPGAQTPYLAALTAAIRQATVENTKEELKALPISDSDNKLLLTVRQGEETQKAEGAAAIAYEAAIKMKKSEVEARVDSLNASIAAIKEYRKTKPFENNTVSLKIYIA